MLAFIFYQNCAEYMVLVRFNLQWLCGFWNTLCCFIHTCMIVHKHTRWKPHKYNRLNMLQGKLVNKHMMCDGARQESPRDDWKCKLLIHVQATSSPIQITNFHHPLYIISSYRIDKSRANSTCSNIARFEYIFLATWLRKQSFVHEKWKCSINNTFN